MRSIKYSKPMSPKRSKDYIVEYGLSFNFGNSLPYFSVTVSAPDRIDVSTGAAHGDVLRCHPDMADIVSLHLSDVYGVPIHAVENAWYWWSDYDGAGTRVRGDNMDILAGHLRMSVEEILAAELPRVRVDVPDEPAHPSLKGRIPDEFVSFVDAQRDRWRREADAVIEKYNLFGWDGAL